MYLLKVIHLSADSKPKHQSLPGLYGTESWRGARTSNLPRHDGKPGECLLVEKGGGGVGGQKKSGVVRRYQFETGSLNSYHTTFLKKSFHKCTVLPQNAEIRCLHSSNYLTPLRFEFVLKHNFIAIHLLTNIA